MGTLLACHFRCRYSRTIDSSSSFIAFFRDIPEGYAAQSEGQATILQKGNEVFYNPAQVVNRDLSIAVINYFEKIRKTENIKPSRLQRNRGLPNIDEGLRILEGLAASGLRSIRYAKEVNNVKHIIANDLDAEVVETMKKNIEFNGADVAQKVQPSVGDARMVMLQNPGAFDVVDLDPYGSPCTLLDSAVSCVSEGGLLLCTATDMAVLCGNNGEAGYAKYGSYPLHKPYCHEQAIRILLASISTAAARHKRHIVPVLSLSIDFYVRVFVRIYTSPSEAKNTALKHSYVFQSQGCDSFELMRVGRLHEKGNSKKYGAGFGPPVQQKCPETGASYTVGGPIWSEPIHDKEWIKGVLEVLKESKEKFKSFDKVRGILINCSDELSDVPLYLDLHETCKTLRASIPRQEAFKSAIINAGYRASPTHCLRTGIKTDAPWALIWDILRCWVKEHPVNVKAGSYAEVLLSKEPTHIADFSRVSAAIIADKKGKNKIARFVGNPENWGPKTKHGRIIKEPVEKKQKIGNRSEVDKKTSD